MKSCIKRDAREPVGVVVKKQTNGGEFKYDIVEYSELSEEDMTAVVPSTGELKFNLGNILVFIMKADKLLELSNNTATMNSLYHKAFKKIPYWDSETNTVVKPSTPNGYKFELFSHNFLPFCEDGRFGVMRVAREEEFGPVKNAEGVDSPQSARDLIFNQGKLWLKASGIEIDFRVEIDMLLSYEGEGLKEQIDPEILKNESKDPFYLTVRKL